MDGCVVVWYSKAKSLCFAFVDRSIYCHCLLSLAVRYIATYSTTKSLRTIVEVTCCDIKVKKKLDGCVIIDSPRLSSRYKLILCSNTSYDQIDLSYRLHVHKINWAMFQAKFSIWRGKGRGIYASKFATFARKLFEPVAICSEQMANQNTNIAAEVCKVARKRTSGLTVSHKLIGSQYDEYIVALEKC